MADNQVKREKLQWHPPDDEARRIDDLIREAEEAVRNTKRFLEGMQEANARAREHIWQMQDRLEKDLKGLRRRQEKEVQI